MICQMNPTSLDTTLQPCSTPKEMFICVHLGEEYHLVMLCKKKRLLLTQNTDLAFYFAIFHEKVYRM